MYEKYIEGLKRNGLNVCTKIVFAFNAFHFLSLGEYQKVQKYIYRHYCHGIHLVPSFMSCIIDKIRIMILDE